MKQSVPVQSRSGLVQLPWYHHTTIPLYRLHMGWHNYSFSSWILWWSEHCKLCTASQSVLDLSWVTWFRKFDKLHQIIFFGSFSFFLILDITKSQYWSIQKFPSLCFLNTAYLTSQSKTLHSTFSQEPHNTRCCLLESQALTECSGWAAAGYDCTSEHLYSCTQVQRV